MKKLNSTIYRLLVAFLLAQPLAMMSQTNQYLHFDRVDDFVQLPNGSQYVSGTTELSLTGWFYCDALAYGQGYMGFRSGSGTAEFYLIQLNNGVMECRLVTTAGFHEYVAPANTIIPQVWQHIAWIYDGSAIKLYVNGALKGSSAASGIFQGENVTFAIGKSILGGFNFVYGGRVDEVSVWKKALTQSEIQDMMENELTGSETDLELYYKFNQGVPGGDNTSITHLVCEIGDGERDAELMNFALIGETSNFNGELDPGYQAISFPQIPNHLNSDPPFAIEASSTSGLEVFFTLLEGPASIDGNIVTLTGEAGEVVIEATQPGNGQYDPADPVINSFMVLDPSIHVPDIDARHPLGGDVFVPSLSKILLSTVSTIGYPELFSVQDVKFVINGQTISTNNYGAAAIETININIVATAADMEVVAADSVLLNTATNTRTVSAELPSFLGAFSNVTATLEVKCPVDGCGEWDRVASVDAKSHDGQWYEIIRYITPYGKPCSHNIDLTDYISMLMGKVEFRFNCSTLDNGYYYGLKLNYTQGDPDYLYSSIYEVWNEVYPFGDYADLQPVENWMFEFPEEAVAAKLKLVSTGHGWGDLNTGNAAEFYEATHHIWINGEQTFEQHNWYDCNPNPDGCQPQNGTWYYNRAGWCPGAIAQWFDYDVTPYISGPGIELGYVFYEDYVDLCHPNHPDCVTGVTCDDCNDGFNPMLDVACNLVVFSQDPLITGTNKLDAPDASFCVKPNPTSGLIEVTGTASPAGKLSYIRLMTLTGLFIEQYEWDGASAHIDLSKYPDGIYFLTIRSGDKTEMKKVIVH
ncbi:MAG: T9SS type A sorting domain-containing protein [Bacteroidales bacterium]|nr:T9SS type A sorting domain-containing protein [Bacteroidales bacterium]